MSAIDFDPSNADESKKFDEIFKSLRVHIPAQREQSFRE